MIIKETYIRSQKKIPFQIHKLIELTSGIYETDDKTEHINKIKNEFYLFKDFKTTEPSAAPDAHKAARP